MGKFSKSRKTAKTDSQIDVPVEEPVAPPAPEVQFVEPGLVPLTFQISQVVDHQEDGDNPYIAMTVFSPTGRAVYFLSPDLALNVGEVLIKKASETTESFE